jgi:hypothetical protein
VLSGCPRLGEPNPAVELLIRSIADGTAARLRRAADSSAGAAEATGAAGSGCSVLEVSLLGEQRVTDAGGTVRLRSSRTLVLAADETSSPAANVHARHRCGTSG